MTAYAIKSHTHGQFFRAELGDTENNPFPYGPDGPYYTGDRSKAVQWDKAEDARQAGLLLGRPFEIVEV